MEKVYIVVVTDRGNTTSVVACGTLSTAFEEFKKAKSAIIERYEDMGYNFDDDNDIEKFADNEFNFSFAPFPQEEGWYVDVKIHTKDIIM